MHISKRETPGVAALTSSKNTGLGLTVSGIETEISSKARLLFQDLQGL
jgi:hypothetical protein